MLHRVQWLALAVVCGIGLLRAEELEPFKFKFKHPALNPIQVHAKPRGGPVALVRDGQPLATIVVAANSPPLTPWNKKPTVAEHAARELAEHVRLAMGAELKIVADDQSIPEGALILLGAGHVSEGFQLDADGLKPEGFRVSTFARGLAILGAPAPAEQPEGSGGLLFGVYDVLERYLGIRWYYPGEDGRVIRPLKDFVVEPVHYTDAPLRVKRTLYPWRAEGFPDGTDFQAHARRFRAGQSTPVTTACHTPTNFAIHKDEAPECFELDAHGKRYTEEFYGGIGMPCYGHPRTLELMLADFERFYRDGDKRAWTRPNGQLWAPPTSYAAHLSPPDKEVDCACEYCAKLMDPGAPPLGRASRLMATYLAKFAAEVKRRWPEKTVFYLPYWNYTLPAEGLDLPDNVVAGVCLMRGAGNAKEPEVAADHDAMISGWRRMTGRPVHLWEYLCWPAEDTALPFQYPHVLKKFQRRHRDDVEGTFVNGGAGPEYLPGQLWAFQHPTLYCWFRLMWNPEFDVDAALDEYAELMYGPARKPMGKLLEALIKRWEETRWKEPPKIQHITREQVHLETMPREEALRLKAWLAEARVRAGAAGLWRRRVDFLGTAVDLFLLESDLFHGGIPLPELQAPQAEANPVVDGKLDEACWRTAPAGAFVDARNPLKPEPDAATSVQAVWTARGVTFGLRASEPAMEKLVAANDKHDSAVFTDDSIELFLDPWGRRKDFYQLVFNTLAASLDNRLSDPNWNAKGVKAAVLRGEGFWSLEVFVPADELGVAPAAGLAWTANFTRMRRAGGGSTITRWSTQYRASNREPEAFGTLRFAE
ncbi:MAG: DUF4838 domain-containing protein [Planctomycetota bacterium]|nr:DUF4838 domain-containing protein [Planctomycetota bacterium]